MAYRSRSFQQPPGRKSRPAQHTALIEAFNRGEITYKQYQAATRELEHRGLVLEAAMRVYDHSDSRGRWKTPPEPLTEPPRPSTPWVRYVVLGAIVLVMGLTAYSGFSMIDFSGLSGIAAGE